MNRTLLTVAAVGALSIAAPALAQPAGAWQGINARQAQLDQRIDVGVQRGDLTRAEAVRLRDEFRMIADLEARYRANGLQASERADLDRRFDLLSARVRYERNDPQARNGGNGRGVWAGGASINQRQAILERRIERGVRNGSLTRGEAARLRGEFRAIANLEARYRASNGLQPRERADLDQRFDLLQARIRTDLADNGFRWDDNRYR